MEKTSYRKSEKKKSEAQPVAEEESELWKTVLAAKPLYPTSAEALMAIQRELEELALAHGQTIEALLQEAHTTHISEAHHNRALGLERRIGYFSK